MWLIVGLGNPGKKYNNTRHNIGARIVEKLGFNDANIILARPKTFMNSSGKAVKTMLKDKKLAPENLVVIHDDIDLPLGIIRIAKNRGSAGHKGVVSVIEQLKTKNFIRLRIGIRPKQYHRLVRGTEKFVLKNFTTEEEKVVKKVIEETTEAINFFLKEGLEKAMNQYNK